MNESNGSKQGNVPLAAWQIRKALEREFTGLIDMSDEAGRRDANDQMFRSRAAAALALRSLSGCDSVTAGRAVVDGFHDEGIDAVAADGSAQMWLVQSKWSDHGDKGISVGEVNSFIDGFRLITKRDFSHFNPRLRALEPQLTKVLDNPQRRITLVLVIMGSQPVSRDVRRRLDALVTEFNRFNQDRPVLAYEIFLMRDIRQILQQDLREAPIELTVSMSTWHKMSGRLEAWQGEVAVGSIADWHEQHGDRLFERNLRKPLGQTEVNLGMVNTLLREPANFCALNNGITMLCESVEPDVWDPNDAESPVKLRITGASVVNGAQTVSAVSEAARQDSKATRVGYVSVKVISLRDAPSELGLQITQATNKQNKVELRDFIALDPAQADIEEDFRLSLPQRYVVMRGDKVRPDEGCSVEEAAEALACLHPDPEVVTRAIADLDLLWERGPQGAYAILFRRRPRAALEIWRTVLLLRAIMAVLSDNRNNRRGRVESVLEQGELLIAHLVMRELKLQDIAKPEFDLDRALSDVPQLVPLVSAWVVKFIDDEFGPTSSITNTFANPKRLTLLAAAVSASLAAGSASPDILSIYPPARPARRPNAVPTLVEAGAIKDGTILFYQGQNRPERTALESWLADDPRRAQASWVNDRVRPLLWGVDGRQYTPTGLVQRMWDLAGWERGRPKAVQGPTRWFVPGGQSLAELADHTLNKLEDSD
ncbi:AIPR family protein [Micromonospora sp. NBC_00617]|uniref:AIPR family protein n=1 Tax=Micromonospora sp. NBC_00617 TaxID=2903587 RepID=UPI0030E4165F